MNDIYEALKSGQTIEDLAADFAAKLNEAEQRIKMEEAAKAAEEEAARVRAAEAEQAAARKVEDFTAACIAFWSAMEKYYPDLLGDEKYSLEDLEGLAKMLVGLLDLGLFKTKPVTVRVKGPHISKSDDDVFADFFKLFQL